MAESGSLQRSSDSNDECDLTLSSLLSSEVSEEVCLSWPSLEMEVLPYRFEPDLPDTNINDRVYPSPFHLKSKLCMLIAYKAQTGKLVYECYATALIVYDPWA